MLDDRQNLSLLALAAQNHADIEARAQILVDTCLAPARLPKRPHFSAST